MQVLRNIGYTLCGLLALLALVLTVSLFWPVSGLQKQARAALEAAPERPGSNAWVDLATLLHEDIDAVQRKALVDGHVQAVSVWAGLWTQALNKGDENPGNDLPAVPVVGGDAVDWEDPLPACGADTPCLPVVREHRQALADAVQARSALFERIDALSRHGHLASPYPAIAYSHIAILPIGKLPTSSRRHVLPHLDGQSGLAMDGLCRDMGTARMLAGYGENLVTSQVGLAWLQNTAQLLAEVLAETPASVALPASCTAAMAPLPAATLGQCRALRGEYAGSQAVIDASVGQIRARPGGALFFNAEKSRYRSASVMGQSCTPAAQMQLASDQRWQHDASVVSLWRMECPSNAIGCILTAIAGPAYDGYVNRAQDIDATLRLLRAAEWLREHGMAGMTLAERLTAMPADEITSPRVIRAGADGRALEIDRYDQRRGDAPIRLVLVDASCNTESVNGGAP